MSDHIENGVLAGDPGSTPNLTMSPNLLPNNSNTPTTNNTNAAPIVADYNSFVNFLKQFVPILLDSSAGTTTDFEKALQDKSSIDCIKKFINEAQCRSLIIQKFYTKGLLLILIINNFLEVFSI